ncbi:MAG: ABC transporter substrate-binding protein [Campylobacterota bacterium]|nr:ABC transporter substrate-binding protein [Campylobacterota bacterium]
MKQIYKTILVVFLIPMLFLGCEQKQEEDIKIGFIAGLSGKYSALGTSIRDGFSIAFDEIDYKINNQKIVIIEKDDKQDVKEAKKIIDNFIKDDIKLVVGNATSSMTAISYDVVNKQKNMLLFSATASSGDFTVQDDNFIRLQVEHSKKRYRTLLDYLGKNKYDIIFFIYDSHNEKYAKDYKKHLGMNIVSSIDLNSPYENILEKVKKSNNNLILIVGNSTDSSNIIQYLRLNKIDTPVLCSGWAKTVDFISNGGKAVEGVVFSTGYDDHSKDKKFISFVEKFKKKYHKEPSVFAAQGYELAQVLITNLKNSSDISTLKQRILETKKYDGLQGDIIFDEYGDVYREYFMMEVKNKEYRKIN